MDPKPENSENREYCCNLRSTAQNKGSALIFWLIVMILCYGWAGDRPFDSKAWLLAAMTVYFIFDFFSALWASSQPLIALGPEHFYLYQSSNEQGPLGGLFLSFKRAVRRRWRQPLAASSAIRYDDVGSFAFDTQSPGHDAIAFTLIPKDGASFPIVTGAGFFTTTIAGRLMCSKVILSRGETAAGFYADFGGRLSRAGAVNLSEKEGVDVWVDPKTGEAAVMRKGLLSRFMVKTVGLTSIDALWASFIFGVAVMVFLVTEILTLISMFFKKPFYDAGLSPLWNFGVMPLFVVLAAILLTAYWPSLLAACRALCAIWKTPAKAESSCWA